MVGERPKTRGGALQKGRLTCDFFASGRRDSNPRPQPWQVRALAFCWTFANYSRVFSQLMDAADDHGCQRPRDRRRDRSVSQRRRHAYPIWAPGAEGERDYNSVALGASSCS